MTTLPQPPKKHFYKKVWFWILIIVVLMIIGGSYAAMKGQQAAQRSSLSYLADTTTAQTRTIKKTISTNGEIKPDATSQLSFSVPGKITEVNVAVGDEVNQKDLLMKLDADGIATTAAQRIEAPFDGRVLALTTFVNDVVSPGQTVMTLGFRSNHIEFIASEAEVLELNVGQQVTISVPSLDNDNATYTGTVTFVDVQKQTTNAVGSAGAVAESGYVVKVSADNLPVDLRTIIGLSVDVVIDIAEKTNVLSLEPSTIQYDDADKPFVYMAPELTEEFYQKSAGTDVKSLLEKRSITTGFVGDSYIEITDGLQTNEPVVLFLPDTTTPASPF